MLQALLKGKLSREQENLEDMLTSNVLGLFRYLPAKEGGLPFLTLARLEDGHAAYEFSGVDVEDVTIELWPQCYPQGLGLVEPDALIEIRTRGGEEYCIFVEVKLHSQKSQHETGVLMDQLAREWFAALDYVQGTKKIPHLLFVTANSSYPIDEVQESMREFMQKMPDHPKMRCSWLSWCDVPRAFCDSRSLALQDISALCERLDLRPFSGIRCPGEIQIKWCYGGNAR